MKQKRYNQVFSECLWKKCVIVLSFIVFFTSFVETTSLCSKSQFLVEHADGTTSCEDCESCPPGQGLSHECGTHLSSNAMVNCVPCQGAYYSTNYDTSSCIRCASCSEGQVVLQNCTPTMDVKCAKKCYSKDRYYDGVGGCLTCSKCCGDGRDVVEDECKQKLGAASNTICSFHSSVNRCDTTTTTTTTTVASSESTTTVINTSAYTSAPTSSPSSVTLLPSIFTLNSQDIPHPSERKGSPNSFILSVTVPVVIFGLLLVTAGCVTYFLYSRQRCSYLQRHRSDAEMESCHSDNERPSSVGLITAEKKFTKSDKVELQVVRTESSEPLLTKASGELTCMCQMDTKKESKLLSSLLDDDNALREICECLDTPFSGLGNYRAVCNHYGFKHCKIVSVFGKHHLGPSGALIEALAATHTELTVEEFATVVEKQTWRKDVPKLLREYDLAQAGNLE